MCEVEWSNHSNDIEINQIHTFVTSPSTPRWATTGFSPFILMALAAGRAAKTDDESFSFALAQVGWRRGIAAARVARMGGISGRGAEGRTTNCDESDRLGSSPRGDVRRLEAADDEDAEDPNKIQPGRDTRKTNGYKQAQGTKSYADYANRRTRLGKNSRLSITTEDRSV
jgi:hypothetical protein